MQDQKKRSRSKRARNNDSIDILASSVIHDLCNQFTIFGANVDSLIDNCDKNSNENLIVSIEGVREQISALLHSFLGYLKDSSVVDFIDYKPDDQIKKIVKILNFRDKVDIKIKSDKRIKLNNMNRSEFNSLVLNLVSNAIDAVRSVRNPNIIIKSYMDGDEYVLEVEDNGIGLPKYYNRIFQPFFTTKGAQGTGLGLFNSKMIVKKYSGVIKASRLKVGSLFFIRLPK